MKIKSFLVRWMLRLFGARMFNQMLKQCEQSATYAVFCEKVYGRNLSQANMVDEAQLQKLISVAGLKRGDQVLDLGCGSGAVTEFLSDHSGAQFLGLDFAKQAIDRAKQRTQSKSGRLSYEVQDLNSLSLQHKTFDCVISIDTLYFVRNLRKTIQEIKEALKPDGQLLIFYSFKRKDSVLPSEDAFRQTDLAEVLSELGFSIQAWDFTDNEKRIWENSLRYAEELKDSFLSEGHAAICKGRVQEAMQNLKWQKEGRMSRYLYLATR